MFLRNLRIEQPNAAATPLLGRYLSEGYKTLRQKDVRASTFMMALFTMSKIRKRHKYPLKDE